MSDVDMNQFWSEIRERTRTRDEAVHAAWQSLENAGLIPRVVLHKYLCRRRGCVLATVIRVGDSTLVRTRDHKESRGMNESSSVESARAKNTLDGSRHWPGHTYHVEDLATWGPAARLEMACRDIKHFESADALLARIGDSKPGHPGKPTFI